eukprot:5740260-Lingulodinium_polyedra.AAC.1
MRVPCASLPNRPSALDQPARPGHAWVSPGKNARHCLDYVVLPQRWFPLVARAGVEQSIDSLEFHEDPWPVTTRVAKGPA